MDKQKLDTKTKAKLWDWLNTHFALGGSIQDEYDLEAWTEEVLAEKLGVKVDSCGGCCGHCAD